jgi:hypothetical protein
MARMWKERFDSAQHGGLQDSLPDVSEAIRRHWTAPTVIPHHVVFVLVCSFTFRFDTKEQLQRVLRYYEQKIVPSSRQPESVWGCAEATTVKQNDGSRNCPFSFVRNRNVSRSLRLCGTRRRCSRTESSLTVVPDDSAQNHTSITILVGSPGKRKQRGVTSVLPTIRLKTARGSGQCAARELFRRTCTLANQ